MGWEEEGEGKKEQREKQQASNNTSV